MKRRSATKSENIYFIYRFQGINLAGIFTKYLIMWVHEAKKKLETWCAKAIEVDTVCFYYLFSF